MTQPPYPGQHVDDAGSPGYPGYAPSVAQPRHAERGAPSSDFGPATVSGRGVAPGAHTAPTDHPGAHAAAPAPPPAGGSYDSPGSYGIERHRRHRLDSGNRRAALGARVAVEHGERYQPGRAFSRPAPRAAAVAAHQPVDGTEVLLRAGDRAVLRLADRRRRSCSASSTRPAWSARSTTPSPRSTAPGRRRRSPQASSSAARRIIGVINIVLFIALSTVGSMIYNLCADLVGGVEITLSES